MRLKLIFGGVILIAVLLVVSFLFIFGDSNEEITDEEPSFVEETSPGRVETTQEKLEALGGEKDEPNKTIEPRVINLKIENELEKVELFKKNQRLNLEETIVDVFGPTMFESSLPLFLSKGEIKLPNGEDIFYEQKISLSEDLEFVEFSDDDYLDGENYTGFDLEKRVNIINYTLSFVNAVEWEKLEKTFIPFFGNEYYVRESIENPERMELWKEAYRLELYEGEIVDIVHPTFGLLRLKINHLGEGEVSLSYNEKDLEILNEGDVHYSDDSMMAIEKISYSKTSAGFIEIVVSPSRLFLLEDEIEDEIEGFIEYFKIRYNKGEEILDSITLVWELHNKTIIAPSRSQKIPFFENLAFYVSKGKYDDYGEYYAIASINAESFKLTEV